MAQMRYLFKVYSIDGTLCEIYDDLKKAYQRLESFEIADLMAGVFIEDYYKLDVISDRD